MNRNWLVNRYAKSVRACYGLPDLVSLVSLSAMTYEKNIVNTKLIFSKDPLPRNKAMSVCFKYDGGKERVNYNEKQLRAVRKLMELSGDGAVLWIRIPEYEIEGCILENDTEDLVGGGVCIKFEDFQVWSIWKNKETVLKYREGGYIIPQLQQDVAKEDEWEKANRCLESVGMSDKFKNIRKAADNISEICQHGTSIVFIDEEGIKEEIDGRLAKNNRAFNVKKIFLSGDNGNIPKGITEIDGALFADFDGNCHAIGVIVDGKAVVKGDYGRGARYNSINNYVACYKKQYPQKVCIAVVISEDGMCNVIV